MQLQQKGTTAWLRMGMGKHRVRANIKWSLSLFLSLSSLPPYVARWLHFPEKQSNTYYII